MQFDQKTHSDLIVKNIDYFTEEWVKQLITDSFSDKPRMVNPFVGCIQFPGKYFPNNSTDEKTSQFQTRTYVGIMQFIHPAADVSLDVDGKPSFTLLEYELDGELRQFVSIAGGDLTAGATTFRQFIYGLYPDANKPLPFNPLAVHIVRNINISGAKFSIVGNSFQQTGQTSGAHTAKYSFSISISGYRVLAE